VTAAPHADVASQLSAILAGQQVVDRSLPLLAAAGPACVVDMTGLVGQAAAGHRPAVTVAELTAWVTAHGELRPGDVVLLRSGWDIRYRPRPEGAACGADMLVTKTAPGWPAPAADAVGWLRELAPAVWAPMGCPSARPKAPCCLD
jgi:kynurenine formamidase